jgi:hypothetical protein
MPTPLLLCSQSHHFGFAFDTFLQSVTRQSHLQEALEKTTYEILLCPSMSKV